MSDVRDRIKLLAVSMAMLYCLALPGSGILAAEDFDFDGIPDASDNCPYFYNPDQVDSDSDGQGDACDSDDDDDGVPDQGGNGQLSCPTSDICLPAFTCSLTGSTCSGAGDPSCNALPQPDVCIQFLGSCATGGGPCTVDADCPDIVDTCQRTCQDSGAPCTTDQECQVSGCDDNCPVTANADQSDSDGDFAGDACDNCPNRFNDDQSDIDGDGVGDLCDGDRDSDGIPDPNTYGQVCSVPPDFNGNPTFTPSGCDDNCQNLYNEEQLDNDGDFVGNVCDNCLQISNQAQTDGDFDGAGDACDNCLTEQNPGQQNDDRDRFGDACDNCPSVGNDLQTDTDFDTYGDACDNCPLASNVSQTDVDGDGVGAVCDWCDDDPYNDVDSDNLCPDSCPSAFDNGTDTDNDGIADQCDCDIDNDGVLDGVWTNYTGELTPTVFGGPDGTNSTCLTAGGGVPFLCGEACFLSDPNLGTTCADELRDIYGLTNNYTGPFPRCGIRASSFFISFDLTPPCCTDNCPYVPNPSQADADRDGHGAACDPDDNNPNVVPLQQDQDKDYALDSADNCVAEYNPLQEDADGDGQGDACDGDDDGDGVPDAADNCRLASNAVQADGDGDGVGDACDNCAAAYNPMQEDRDQDLQGDSCDADDQVIAVEFQTPATIRWDAESGYTQWTVISGDLGTLKSGGDYLQGQGSSAPATYCGTEATAQVDSVQPAPGQAVFFLVGGMNTGVETGFGNDSEGNSRVSTTVCP